MEVSDPDDLRHLLFPCTGQLLKVGIQNRARSISS